MGGWWYRQGVLVLAACGVGCGADLVPDAEPPGAVFRGVVRGFAPELPLESMPRLSDVEVCNVDRPDLPCVRTAADGSYELGGVGLGDAMVSFTHADHAPSAWLRVATEGVIEQDATLLSGAQHRAFYAPVGATFPLPGYGVVAINDTTHRDGISFSAAGAMGPFYSRDGVTLDPDATGTVGDGLAFFIAPAGTLSIEISAPEDLALCGNASGGFLSTGHGLTVPVVEGTEVGVFTRCY